VQRGLSSVPLVRVATLRGRRDLCLCCGARRQWPARPGRLLFAYLPWRCRQRWLAFFRRRTERVCERRLRPVRREWRTSDRRFQLLLVRPCLGIVAHHGADENNQPEPLQLARSWAPRFLSRAAMIFAEKSLVCASVSVASRLWKVTRTSSEYFPAGTF